MNESFEQKAHACFEQAKKLSAAGNHKAASVEFSKACSFAPRSLLSVIYVAWARDALADDDWDNALYYSQKAVDQLDPALGKSEKEEIKKFWQYLDATVSAAKAAEDARTAEEERVYLAAVQAAGGYEPEHPRFKQTMKVRADSGLVDGGFKSLEERLAPILKPRTMLIKAKKKLMSTAAPPPGDSRVRGEPYAEIGDVWPRCAPCRKEMSFVFQIDTTCGDHEKLPGVGLVQLFACRSCEKKFQEGVIASGYVIRNYSQPDPANFVPMLTKKPARLGFLLVRRPGKVLSKPTWPVLQSHYPDIAADIASLYPPDPDALYDTLLPVDEQWRFDYEYPYVFLGNYAYHHHDTRSANPDVRIDCDRCARAMDVVCDMTSLGSGGNFLDGGHAYIVTCPCTPGAFVLYMGY